MANPAVFADSEAYKHGIPSVDAESFCIEGTEQNELERVATLDPVG